MSTITYTGVRITDMPDLGPVTDSSSVVGERAGSGRFSALQLRSYVLTDFLSVKQFGARGDGTTDDTAAFNAALAYVASKGGGKLYVPDGDYPISGPLTYSAGFLTLAGDGHGSRLLFGSRTADLLTFTGPDILLTDFSVRTPFQTSTNGVLLNFKDCNNAKINRVWTDGGWDVVQFLGLGYRPTITDCNFVNVMCNGVYYSNLFGGAAMIANTEMLGAPTNTGIGIVIQSGDTFNFSNMNIAAFVFGVLANSQPGGSLGYVANIFAVNVLCDGAGSGDRAALSDAWCFLGGAGGTFVTRIHLSFCWGGYMGRHGFNIENASDVTLVNCVGIANSGHGFLIDNPSQCVTIDACTATWNSLANAGINDGIHIGAAVTDFSVTGCRSRPSAASAGVPNTQRYGIAVDAGPSDRYIVVNNQLTGNMTGAFADGGSGVAKIVTPNML